MVDSLDVPRVVEAGLLPLPEAEFVWADIFPELRQERLRFRGGRMYAMPQKFGYNTLAYDKAKVAAAGDHALDRPPSGLSDGCGAAADPDAGGQTRLFDTRSLAPAVAGFGLANDCR